ncbi:MAG: TonB-dependent receptor [Bacteroidota bacterium]
MYRFILFCFSLLITSYGWSQHILQGTISNTEGEPLLGANVYLLNSFDGTSSGEAGTFSFKTSRDTGTLVVSYMGYEMYQSFHEFSQDTIELAVELASSSTELETVQIHAGAFEAGDEKKGVVLNSIDVVTTAGALADIATALNTLPGTQRVGEDGQLYVRGGAAYETRVFMDGMRVQSPYGSRVPDVPARGRFSPFLFKGTMFSTGGYSAEYGQGLSSALVLNTQDLPENSVTGVSLMTVGTELAHTQRWDNTSLALTGSYTNLAPYMGLIDQNLDWLHAPESYGGSMAFRHQTQNLGMWKGYATMSSSSMRLQYPSLLNSDEFEGFGNKNQNALAQTTYSQLLSSGWLVRGGLSYAYNFDEFSLGEGIQADQMQRSAQARVVLSKDVKPRLNLKVGATTLWENFEETYFQPGFQAETQIEESYSAAFGELEASIGKSWALRVGARGEYSHLLGKANVAPRVSMAWKTSSYGQFSLASGIYFQTPEYEHLRSTQSLGFEQARHYILNYQWNKDRRIFRLEGYYKTYHDLITFRSESDIITSGHANTGDGYARGVDFFYRDSYKTFKKVDFWVSYSFLDTERTYRDFPVASTPYFASAHNFSWVGKYFIEDVNIQLGMTYSHSSGRPFEDPNEEGFQTQRTPTFNDLALNASYLTQIAGNFTVLHVAVSNVLGAEQVFGYRYTGQPNDQGQFPRRVVGPPAKRFFFIGLFVSIE